MYEFCLFIQQCGRAVAARNFSVKADDIDEAHDLATAKAGRICKREGWVFGGIEYWGAW